MKPSDPSRPAQPAAPVRAGFPGWVWGVFGCGAVGGGLIATAHPAWAFLCLMAPAPWFVYQLLPCGSAAFGAGVRSFVTDLPQVWLTIDDGPDPRTTPTVLAVLRSRGAKATFFLIGRRARAHPELVAQILAEGHEIGNHTESHGSATFWGASIARLRKEIENFPVANVRWFRPPAGIKNPWLPAVLGRSGLTLALWSARGLDGLNRSAEKSFNRIAPQLRRGAIVLIHEVPDAPDRTRQFVELVTTEIAARGLTCVLPRADALRRSLP